MDIALATSIKISNNQSRQQLQAQSQKCGVVTTLAMKFAYGDD